MSQHFTSPSQPGSFLRSLFEREGRFCPNAQFREWFERRRAAGRFEVRRIPFAGMDQWLFTPPPRRLVHRSGRFFSVEGLRVRVERPEGVQEWDQPIIVQPEVGILGILTRVVDGVRYFLMQAKMEPGNINTLQLSPTVQATRSNYTRVHEGKLPTYLEYFADPARARILVDQLQPEQGARFLAKRNRNMIVEVDGEVPPHEDFAWLTLGQIKALLRADNLVNMDARTVLACVPFDAELAGTGFRGGGQAPQGFGADLLHSLAAASGSCHTLDEIVNWVTARKSECRLTVERIPLGEVRGWQESAEAIREAAGRYFSVVAVAVAAGSREVRQWTQPLLLHDGCGVVGFVTQKIGGVLHFLVRACVEPGNRDVVDLGPTVACSGTGGRLAQPGLPRYADLFLDPDPAWVRYSAVQSEEGGRFADFQNRYVILELPADHPLEPPRDYLWMTLGQVAGLARQGCFNIEARNLLACLDFAAEA